MAEQIWYIVNIQEKEKRKKKLWFGIFVSKNYRPANVQIALWLQVLLTFCKIFMTNENTVTDISSVGQILNIVEESFSIWF